MRLEQFSAVWSGLAQLCRGLSRPKPAAEPLVLEVVKQAEQLLLAKSLDDSNNKEYLPIDGLPAFRAATVKLGEKQMRGLGFRKFT